MKDYKDYFLIKAFPKQSYRDHFNSGEGMYLNSVEYFHSHGDSFQQDFEGGIFRQASSGQGVLVFSKAQNTLEQIVEKYTKKQFSLSDVAVPTQDFKLFIQGYICCFSFFPKECIRFDSGQIVFKENTSIQKDFYDFLNGYAKSQGYTFFSVYDAELFIPAFCDGLNKNGYSVSCGDVRYQPISTEKRMRDFQNKDIQSVVYTKDISYAYQKEFRFFIQSKEPYKDHIEIDGIDLRESVVCSLAYLTNEYVQENHIVK